MVVLLLHSVQMMKNKKNKDRAAAAAAATLHLSKVARMAARARGVLLHCSRRDARSRLLLPSAVTSGAATRRLRRGIQFFGRDKFGREVQACRLFIL